MRVLTALLLLGIMILPTIKSVSENVLSEVPKTYYSGSLALGASHVNGVFLVILPAARDRILSAQLLGISVALKETMAV